MSSSMNLLRKALCLALLFLTISISSSAQYTKKYYNYKWEECAPNVARYLSLTTKTDSGYYRKDYYIRERKLQMIGTFSDSQCKIPNGYFTYYHSNGILQSVGRYKQKRKEGIWVGFHDNGLMSDSTNYSNGKPIGTRLTWHPNGYLRDSLSLQEDRSGAMVSWFDNGVPSAAGRCSAGMKQNGKWKYYHKNGNLSSVEIYKDSKLVDKQYFNESGELMKDTTNTDRRAEFKGGIEAWLKYISHEIYFPANYKIINADMAIVVVNFTINEDGDIENVFTSSSFEKKFDRIAERAIKRSPKWAPAMAHNRRIKQKMNQAVRFQNYKE